MSDLGKERLKSAKLAAALKAALGGAPNGATVGGVRVVTNADSVARFPLPLTIGGAVVLAIGVLLMFRGHRVSGALVSVVGGVAVGAAAAAPELQAQLSKLQGGA